MKKRMRMVGEGRQDSAHRFGNMNRNKITDFGISNILDSKQLYQRILPEMKG